jgi:hypothetical protein
VGCVALAQLQHLLDNKNTKNAILAREALLVHPVFVDNINIYYHSRFLMPQRCVKKLFEWRKLLLFETSLLCAILKVIKNLLNFIMMSAI